MELVRLEHDVRLLHRGPKLLERPRGFGGDHDDLRLDGGVAEVRAPRDAHPLDAAVKGRNVVGRLLSRGYRVPVVVAGQRLQQHGGVLDRARHWAGL